MKALRYFARILLFGLLFLLALNNTAPTNLTLPLGVVYTLPQIVWFLLFFVLGIVFSFLAFLPRVWRLKSEIRQLTRANVDIFNQKTNVELRLQAMEAENKNGEQNTTVNEEKNSNVPALSA